MAARAGKQCLARGLRPKQVTAVEANAACVSMRHMTASRCGNRDILRKKVAAGGVPLPSVAYAAAARTRPGDRHALRQKTPSVAALSQYGTTPARTYATAATAPLGLSPNTRIDPADVVFGGVWLGPHVGRTDEGKDVAVDAVHAALMAGVRIFDTAPLYSRGLSEERMGAALASLPAGVILDQITVCTKAGRLVRGLDGTTAVPLGYDAGNSPGVDERRCINDYSFAGAAQSLAESMERLGVPRAHVLRIHDPNDNEASAAGVDEVEQAIAEDGLVAGMVALRTAGVIDEVSIGMNINSEAHQGNPEQVVRLVEASGPGTFDNALLAGGWNLLSQAGVPALQACQNHGIPVEIAGVYASGLLVGGDSYAYVPAPEDKLQKAKQWSALAQGFGVSVPAVAIRFAMLPDCVTKLVVGMSTADQVHQNFAAIEESHSVPLEVFLAAGEAGLLSVAVMDAILNGSRRA